MSTTARGICGVIFALQTYEHYLIGSHHPEYTDHEPLMYLWGRRGKLSHRFFRYQLVFSQFLILKIIWTERKNLAFPDILSLNEKIKDLDKYQLDTKRYQKTLPFKTSMVTRKNTSLCVIVKRDQRMIVFQS